MFWVEHHLRLQTRKPAKPWMLTEALAIGSFIIVVARWRKDKEVPCHCQTGSFTVWDNNTACGPNDPRR